MHGIASGSIPPGKGKPSKAVAEEFADADKPGKLPETKRTKAKRAFYDHATSKAE